MSNILQQLQQKIDDLDKKLNLYIHEHRGAFEEIHSVIREYRIETIMDIRSLRNSVAALTVDVQELSDDLL